MSRFEPLSPASAIVFADNSTTIALPNGPAVAGQPLIPGYTITVADNLQIAATNPITIVGNLAGAETFVVLAMPGGQLQFQWNGTYWALRDVVQRTTTRLSATDIKQLFSAPKILVPAPGAGFMHMYLNGCAIFHFGTAQYTDGNLSAIVYKGPPDYNQASVTESGLVAWNASQVVTLPTPGITGGSNDIPSLFDNQPLVLANLTANPTSGDGTMTINAIYTTVPTK